MLNLSCHCGRVSLRISKRPDYINACNCSLCRKSGAVWSYFTPFEVAVTGETASYSRSDKTEAAVRVCFCPKCGTTTHFDLTDETVKKIGNTLTGVNMRLADDDTLVGIELRYPDGRAWSGIGEFGYVKNAIILGSDTITGES